jgi:hypothetical protein
MRAKRFSFMIVRGIGTKLCVVCPTYDEKPWLKTVFSYCDAVWLCHRRMKTNVDRVSV